MKKILSIMVLVSLALFTKPLTQQVKAQDGSSKVFPVIAGDSLATADTVFKLIPLTDGYRALGIQASIKKGTGTLDGKLYVYTSVGNGSVFNYVLSDSASFTAVPTAALITNGGYTHTAWINKASPPGTRYLVAVTQTGSLTASPVKVWYTARK